MKCRILAAKHKNHSRDTDKVTEWNKTLLQSKLLHKINDDYSITYQVRPTHLYNCISFHHADQEINYCYHCRWPPTEVEVWSPPGTLCIAPRPALRATSLWWVAAVSTTRMLRPLQRLSGKGSPSPDSNCLNKGDPSDLTNFARLSAGEVKFLFGQIPFESTFFSNKAV